MANVFGLILRVLVGAFSLIATFLVLDAIHDRNGEIVVACLGLGYCFTFVISRRWQYYGLNVVSLFGMTVSWLGAQPFDEAVRGRINMPTARSFVVVSLVFAALVELLCGYRLLTSLLGHGWERLAPVRGLIEWPVLRGWLDAL